MDNIKPTTALSDRELQERMIELLEKQEKHQHYFSTILTILIVLSFIGLCILIMPLLSK